MKVYNRTNYSFASRTQTASPVARTDDSASFATMLAGKMKGMANSIKITLRHFPIYRRESTCS